MCCSDSLSALLSLWEVTVSTGESLGATKIASVNGQPMSNPTLMAGTIFTSKELIFAEIVVNIMHKFSSYFFNQVVKISLGPLFIINQTKCLSLACKIASASNKKAFEFCLAPLKIQI
jgi:predicted alpha/beta-fold hydrolase